MNSIQTILGEINCKELGLIAPHEHIFVDTSFEGITPSTEEEKELYFSPVSIKNIDVLRRNPFIVRDNMILDDCETALNEINRFKKAGGRTIVELTNFGAKRDFSKLRWLSKMTGTNIIVGCGLYTSITIDKKFFDMSEDAIAEWMIDEIKNGDKESGVRPGVIGEIGTSAIIDDIETRSLRAAAFASISTGLPIYVHTYPWSRASFDAVKLLISEGVRPEKICICHLDVRFDYYNLSGILDKGVYVMFDNFGKEYYFQKTDAVFAGGPFENDLDRVRMIKRIIKDNKTNRLLLATDVCLKSLLHSYGGWGYDHIFTNIVPMMQNEGIDQADIDTIIIKNPTNFLCDS